MDTTARTTAAAHGGKLEALARAGYAAKGVVYATIGLLTAGAVFGWFGGDIVGGRGAVENIASQPFGNALLIALMAGLAGYVIWRFTQAFVDTEGKGDGAAGRLQRVGFLLSGLVYASLAVYAISLTGWISAAGGENAGRQALTARLMSADRGILAVGLAGLAIVGVGVYQAYRAVSGKFTDNWKTAQMSVAERRFARRFGRFGIGARSVTFGVIGGLMVRAAMEADPSDAQGLGHALGTLYRQELGPWLLGFVGLGLVCYGLYCFVNARYRRVDV